MDSKSNAGLLPCPFCGDVARHTKASDAWLERHYDFYVQCVSCKAQSPHFSAQDDDSHGAVTKAIEAWNRRPPAGHVVVPVEVKDRIVQFLGWVAESYRAHAKGPDNHPEITDAYEGSAQMADELIAMLAARPQP